jgi:predicted nucleic acid-binding protein
VVDDYVLVDSSAWIASFRSSVPPGLQRYFNQALALRLIVTAPLIKLELLQGTRTQHEYDDLRLTLESLYELPMTAAVWERAYSLGFTLRRNGLTIPTTDVLIAAVALEYDCTLLHQDRHFPMIQSVAALRTVEVESL